MRLVIGAQPKPSDRAFVVVVSSPLQLKNAGHFLASRGVRSEQVALIVCLSGIERWDYQMLRLAKELPFANPLILRRSRQKKEDVSSSSRLATVEMTGRGLGALLGMNSLGRTRALFEARGLLLDRLGVPIFDWVLLLGNPLQQIPLFSLLLRPGRQIVVVDDGLSMLEFARARRDVSLESKRFFPRLKSLSVPGLSERKISVYTLFTDADFSDDVEVLANRGHAELQGAIAVTRGECWILGNPLVEEGGLDAEEYREIIAALALAARRRALRVTYLPHRRENLSGVRNLFRGLRLCVESGDVPVEEEVASTGLVAEVVVGLGTTALELLDQMVPPDCRLWNLLVVAPKSKHGADSPAAIFDRYAKSPRIGSILPEDLSLVRL